MKHFLSALLTVGLFSAQSQQAGRLVSAVVFRNVGVIPMDNEHVLKNQDVVIQDGKILEIANAGKAHYPANADIIDGTGKFLIPGLVEMHAHVPPIGDMEPMKEVVMLFALKGVTTIRGMLGHPLHLELRKKIQHGEIVGPRLYTSGPSLNGNTVKTVGDATRMVREQKAAGYDFLKLHPGLTLENFNAIVKTAKEVNIPFAGHVSWDVGIWRAIDAGYASVDHLDGFVEGLIPGIESRNEEKVGFMGSLVAMWADTTRMPKLIKELVEHHIGVVPTQALAERWFGRTRSTDLLRRAPEMRYVDQQTTGKWVESKENTMSNRTYTPDIYNAFIRLRRKLIFECQKGGVMLLLGSDAPQVFNVPGFSLHQELEYMVSAGLTPYQALRTGTVNPAFYFKRPDCGMVKAGYVSDLVLLRGNPLENIRETTNIEGVMLGNRWLSTETISAELKKLVKQ